MMACIVMLTWACEEDVSPGPIPPSGNMVINLSNLEVLPDGYAYEGWIVVNGEVNSTGQFNVNADGEVKNLTLPVESALLESASRFILSVESTTDGDPAPSAVKILSGDFSQYEAILSTNGEQSIGIDFENDDINGKYLINAPTTASVEDDTSGIWFIDNSGGSAVAGLNLPTLNAGWQYEGWVIIGGQLLSTGTFINPNASDGSCEYCGPLSAPNFPGEDFITNAPDGLSFPTLLTDESVVISIEPNPDYSDAPSNLKLLESIIPSVENIEIGTSYDMNSIDVAVPTGNVKRFYGFDCTNNGCS